MITRIRNDDAVFTGLLIRDDSARAPLSVLIILLHNPSHLTFSQNQNIAITMAEKADVLVIGAGMAGLSAANRLIDDNLNTNLKVVVLEGRDRVGGRVQTATMGGGRQRVDVGGAWLQYPSKNPVRRYLHGVEQLETPTDSIALYDEDGNEFDGARISEIQAGMIRRAATCDEVVTPSDPALTLVDVMPMLQQDKIECSSDPEERLAAMLLRTTVENYMASSVEQLSGFVARYIGVGGDFVPPQNVLKQGFGAALDALAGGLDVRLEHVVTRIEILEDGSVKVSTKHGKVFEAQKAIVTLPLGVLKSGSVEFVPPLSERRRLAIKRTGFGLLDKVVLRFPSIFWKEDVHFLTCATPDRSEVSMFLSLAGINEPILVGFHQGLAALENEELGDGELREKAMAVLRRMYGPGIPEPCEVICTRWGTDPMSLGSYSAPQVSEEGFDLGLEDAAVLAGPIGKSVYFAGEAASKQPGLIHGAYNSGIRAAGEIERDGLATEATGH